MLRSMLLATLASAALLVTVNTSDAAWRRDWGGWYGRGYYGARPYYNTYRPYASPFYPSYYGPTYYPGTSFYYRSPGVGVFIR
jgi:hypothetical protein